MNVCRPALVGQTTEGSVMIAAMGLGLIGSVLLIVLVIAGIMFFLRRA
jgi:hypothetical protein